MTMQVFVAVVEAGSQTAAADKLGLSRPVVSRCLAELENWVGARLLHRTTRRLHLTHVGEEVLPMCQRMLDLAQDIQASARHPEDEPQGQLRVTCSTSFGHAQLTDALAEFHERFPRVRIDLQLLDRTVNLVEEGIDLAVRISNDLDPQLIARHLAVCESILCAAPSYLQTHGIPQQAKDLERHNCLTHAYHDSTLWRFELAGEPVGVAVSGSLSSNDSVALMHAVTRGAGIALLPTYLCAGAIREGRLEVVLPDYRPTSLDIHAVYASRKHMSASLRTLLDFLVERFASVTDWHLS